MTTSRRQRRLRRGFTLLEVLAALALSALLIAAVYSGLDMYYRFSTAGRDEVERAQVTRAVLHRIERDLRAVIYQAPQDAASSGAASSGATSGTSGSSTSSSTSSTTSSGTGGSTTTSANGSTTTASGSTPVAATSEESGVSAGSGLFGDATTIMLHISQPNRELASVTDGNAATQASDLRTVSYFVAGKGAGQLQSMVKIQGLARLQGDRLALNLADQQTNLSLLAASTESLAPEITSITFRYYDGFNWRFDWDSSTFGGVPKAIEITIEMNPPEPGTREKLFKSAEMAAPVKSTVVVVMPLGKLIDTSALQL
jgi:prepilin-type N-terminal cleavage/methylation domain-containing protein